MENQPKLNSSKEVIAFLAERFPHCFSAEGEARPLKIGIFQDIEKKDDDLSEAKLQEHIKETLKEISTPEISLSVEALGIPDVISGVGVYVIIDELGIKRTFYVDEDSHTFKGGSHTMNLTLNSVNE